MINQEIASIFDKMASYIDLMDPEKGFFKSRAYRKASDIISSLPIDLNDQKFVDSPQLLIAMEGIGKTLAEHIVEYIKTGKISEYERFKNESPVKLEELLQVQGLGPKKILKLYTLLGITDIETLKNAADQNKISNLDGFGQKSQQNIIENLQFAITNKDRKPYFIVEPIVNDYLEYLSSNKQVVKVDAFGSYRRRKEMIGDIDFLAVSSSPEVVMDLFTSYSRVEKILSKGDTKSSVWLIDKIQVDIRVISLNEWGAASQYFTGSKEHNVKLRNLAISKGYKLSEYGLFTRKDNKLIESANEKKIYESIGLPYIIPELRENNGEIEKAIKNELPKVIETSDIIGDLHTHTKYSDGNNTIEEMVDHAKSIGHKYIGITDHVGQLTIAGAIPESNFKEYLTHIRNIDAKVDGIKVYAGVECDIDKEGNLSYNEDLLFELDYVIAAVHLSTKMDSDKMTRRLEKAILNPLTKILAHPTGRLLGQRPGYEFDYEYIFRLCAKKSVILEINSDPHRLDLNDTMVRTAINYGCKIAINTDAHSIDGLLNLRYGVNIGRRGWLTTDSLFLPSFV